MKVLTEPDLFIDSDGRLHVENGQFEFDDEADNGPDGTAFNLRLGEWAIAEANRRLQSHPQDREREDAD